MFEGILNFFKGLRKTEKNSSNSGGTAKERLHLVLMQDRANVSADFLELMKQEIIDVIKKYIEVDESAIDVRLTNKNGEDGENGAPALYANIPILNIRNDLKKIDPATGKAQTDNQEEQKQEDKKENTESKTEQEEIKDNNDDNKDDENKEKQEEVIEENCNQEEKQENQKEKSEQDKQKQDNPDDNKNA